MTDNNRGWWVERKLETKNANKNYEGHIRATSFSVLDSFVGEGGGTSRARTIPTCASDGMLERSTNP